MVQKTKAKKKLKKKVNKKVSKRQKKNRRIAVTIVIIIILITAIGLFLMSSVFNITKITVKNNNRITEEQIVQASTLQINENRFKKSKNKIVKNIKTIPYIESVKVSKRINGEVVLDITEREPTYMLKQEEKFAYINNQGYILEIAEIPLELPQITGYISTEIEPGKRLETKDLKKLDTVIKIMETAKAHDIAKLITNIDITEDKNFILSMPSQLKTIELGDDKDINIKILKIVEVLKKTEGQEGIIFMKNRVYFQEKV